MSTQSAVPELDLVTGEALNGGTIADPPSRSGRVWTAIVLVWKYAIGMLLTQNPLTSILVIGWSYRVAERAALKRWWKASPARDPGETFGEFTSATSTTDQHAHWPNWIVTQNFRRSWTTAFYTEPAIAGRARAQSKVLFGSLAANSKLGVQAIFNTWVFTLPGCVLWLFAWYAGWNNSFHKGYEQAPIGPLTGIVGVVLFIAAMFYVPMAQSRQAVTGSWRSFYDFRLVGRLVRRRWRACIGIAAWYAALSLPVTILKTAPGFFSQAMGAEFDQLSDSELYAFLTMYFFWSAALFFPLYLWLRVVAARVYASAILSELHAGHVNLAELAERERSVLEQLGLTLFRAKSRRHLLIRTAASTARIVGTTAVILATALVWFSFVAQIFVSEFLNYHLALGWLNQPLVQLPWFCYIPGGLAS